MTGVQTCALPIFIDIFRDGVDRGNDEASSYDWGCSPSSSFNECLASSIKDVLNKGKKWDDSDYIQIEAVMEWINGRKNKTNI